VALRVAAQQRGRNDTSECFIEVAVRQLNDAHLNFVRIQILPYSHQQNNGVVWAVMVGMYCSIPSIAPAQLADAANQHQQNIS
jgi:hypothetical protein